MAIYHYSESLISKTKGHSAVAAIAYQMGIKIKNTVTGKIEDYEKKEGVVYSEAFVPENSPQWLKDIAELQTTNKQKSAELLWNSVEQRETRKNAQYARNINFALPLELNEEQCKALVKDYVTKAYTAQGMVASCSIHFDSKGNPHVHVLVSLRDLNANGWANKNREWSSKEALIKRREILAEVTNHHLRQAGYTQTISHLSYAAQGINQEPTIHEGNKKNKVNEQARHRNQEIRRRNLLKIIDNPEIVLEKVAQQNSIFSLADVAKALNAQLEAANQNLNKPDPGSPRISSKRSMGSSFVSAIGSLAQQWNPLASTDKEIAASLAEVPKPALNIPLDASPQQVIEAALDEITKHESVFSEKHLSTVLKRHLNNPDIVAQAIIKIKESSQLLALGLGEDGRERFTTRDLFDIENQLQDLGDELNHTSKHQVKGRFINKYIKQYALGDDQAKAVRHVLKGGDIVAMVGRAGSGKGYCLKAVKDAFDSAGYQVHGVSVAGIATDNLEQETKIKSRTIESFAHAIKEEKLVLTNKDVVILDEAGMADSLSMAKVMTAVSQAKAKLVLVGDHAQLQPVGPGATFRALIERIGFAELTTIRRQHEAWQREATAHFATGRTTQALEYYEKHQAIQLAPNFELAKNYLINDWLDSLASSELKDNLILAYSNKDVDRLNEIARMRLTAKGRLEKSYKAKNYKGVLEIAVGERILFLENNWLLGVKNGSRGTITNINMQNEEVKSFNVKLDNKDAIVNVDLESYQKFNYGYACTVHRSQGLTVKNAFVYVSGYWNKMLAYVAISRHRNSARIYASEEEYKTIHDLKKSLSKGTLKDSVLDYPLGFATRRNIETDEPSNLARFYKHVETKLRDVKENVAKTYERITNPTQYWGKVTANEEYKKKVAETLERRENAKLVADYVDAHRELGKAWEQFNNNGKQTNHQQALDVAQYRRDELAAKIYPEAEKYSRALEIYDLSLENLAKQAKTHQYRQRVISYLKASDKVVLRDKLAFEIEPDIKVLYPHLMAYGAVAKDIVRQAKNHKRRAFMVKLTAEQREAFRRVEKYRELSRKAGKLWNTYYQIPTNKNNAFKASALNQERDKLAYQIKKNQEIHQPALDFFDISAVNPAIAEARTQRLEKQALAYERKQKLAENIESFKTNIGNLQNRLALAKQIIETPNYYHAIKEQDINIQQLWKYAKQQQKIERLNALTSEEKQHYLIAIKYKYYRREAGKAWAEIFNNQELNNVLPEEKFAKARNLNTARNKVANLISKDIAKYQEYLFTAQVQAKDITKHATAYEASLRREKALALKRNVNKVIDFNQFHKEVGEKVHQHYWNVDYITKTLNHQAGHFVESLLGAKNHKLSNATTYRYGKKGSLSVTVAGSKAGLWYNFETGEKGNLIGLVQYQYNYDFKQALKYAAEWANISPETQSTKIKEKTEKTLDLKVEQLTPEQLEKIKYAKTIASNSIPIAGTLAERYLIEHRGIATPSSFKNILFNPKVWESETKKECPALVVTACDSKNEVQAVQCIFLDPITANKMAIDVKKRTYGSQKGAAVLVQKAKYTNGLNMDYAITEGPETGLSVAQSNPHLGVFVTLGVSNFDKVPIPLTTQNITLCCDNDGENAVSQKAIDNAVTALAERGLNVYIAKPVDCKDFNDVLLKHGQAEVKTLTDNKALAKAALTLQDLANNKEALKTDTAKIVAEFHIAHQEYIKLEKSNIDTFERKTNLLNKLGEFANLDVRSVLLKEAFERHDLSDQVEEIKQEYQLWKAIRQEADKITKELNGQEPIAEYLKVQKQLAEMPPTYKNKSPEDAKLRSKLDDRENKLAFVIHNTPALLEKAKKEDILESVDNNAKWILQEIAKNLNLSNNKGIQY